MLLTPLHDKVLEWHCNPLQHSAMLSIQLQRPGSELFSLALLKQVFPYFHYSRLRTTALFAITREAAGIGCDPRITRPSASRFFSGVRARWLFATRARVASLCRYMIKGRKTTNCCQNWFCSSHFSPPTQQEEGDRDMQGSSAETLT